MKKVKTSPEKLAAKLLQIRKHLNMSQSEILRVLGFYDELFRSNISQYERGDREPPLLVLLSYARLVHITVDELLDDQISLVLTKGKDY